MNNKQDQPLKPSSLSERMQAESDYSIDKVISEKDEKLPKTKLSKSKQ